MQVKKTPDERLVTRLAGKSSLELADKCPDRLVVFPSIACSNIGCEYSIQQPGYMNCTFVAAEAGGEHSLESIGEMMGITREGVRLIELRAMKKLRLALDQRLNQHHEDRPTILQPRLAPGPNRISTIDSVHKPKNPSNQLRNRNGRELDKCSRGSA
jgi:hypothetical protein